MIVREEEREREGGERERESGWVMWNTVKESVIDRQRLDIRKRETDRQADLQIVMLDLRKTERQIVWDRERRRERETGRQTVWEEKVEERDRQSEREGRETYKLKCWTSERGRGR